MNEDLEIIFDLAREKKISINSEISTFYHIWFSETFFTTFGFQNF